MGRWEYKWRIEYYNGGLFIHDMIVSAKTRADALEKFWETVNERVIEIRNCCRIDTW